MSMKLLAQPTGLMHRQGSGVRGQVFTGIMSLCRPGVGLGLPCSQAWQLLVLKEHTVRGQVFSEKDQGSQV